MTKEYKIKTIKQITEIVNIDNVKNFKIDFCAYIDFIAGVKKTNSLVGKDIIEIENLDTLTWIDDSKNDAILKVTVK